MIARSSPPLTPFKRLRIYDGLLITAESWRQSQAYHRERQNFHYQSLSQGGIVEGLGVTLLYPGSSEEQHGRQLLIRPGAALDALGNPIIVPEPLDFEVQSEPRAGDPQTVYLVVNYVDPETLSMPHPAMSHPGDELQEQFRIVEKTHLGLLDVELCRICLSAGRKALQLPKNVMQPSLGLDVLDLRHRQRAAFQQGEAVRMAQVSDGSWPQEQVSDRLSDLLDSAPALYPSLGSAPSHGNPTAPNETDPLTLFAPAELATAELQGYDLLYLPQDLLDDCSDAALRSLRRYLDQGGVVLITVEFDELGLEDLLRVQADLNRALDSLDPGEEIYGQILDELTAVEADIDHKIQSAPGALAGLAAGMGVPLQGKGTLTRDHPLRRSPFLFSQLPEMLGQPIDIKNWGGLVLMVGNLVHHWGLDDDLQLPRETLRTAQEFGMNLLNFARQRRLRTQLLQPESHYSA